ncbi:MAG: hypothetical protein HC884_01145 [Chloroflexaceae bacterium]|nr:hypothetical protein [Chloroflexaceae bacterium]
MKHLISTRLLPLASGYLAGLFAWVLLRTWAGDRWWWLFLLNSIGGYLFVPLVGVVPVALLARRWQIWPPLVAALVIWGSLGGAELVVPFPTRLNDPSPSLTVLTVMTYNTLKSNRCAQQVVATIQAASPDVAFLQELSQENAEAIWRELADRYPYQVFDLHRRSGMGVISRYPIRPVWAHLPGAWLGQPQALRLDLGSGSVTILNIHMVNLSGGQLPLPAAIEQATREREQQAETLRAFAVTHPAPLIVAGDFNATQLNRSYAILASELHDAWREGEWGVGHTYPVVAFPWVGWRSPCEQAPVPLPCLFRIDHIFHSRHWQTLSARVGPPDGGSDHHPLVVRLWLKEQGAAQSPQPEPGPDTGTGGDRGTAFCPPERAETQLSAHRQPRAYATEGPLCGCPLGTPQTGGFW